MKFWCDRMALWLALQSYYSLPTVSHSMGEVQATEQYYAIRCRNTAIHETATGIIGDTNIAHECCFYFFASSRERRILVCVYARFVRARHWRYKYSSVSQRWFSFLQFCVFDMALCRGSSHTYIYLTMLIAIINMSYFIIWNLFLFTATNVK